MIRTLCVAWAAAILFFFGSVAQANDSGAPFGLEWGMSSKDAEALGIKLQASKAEDGTASFQAQGLPRILGDVESVRLDFGYNDKLRKVVAVSRQFPNDPYGNKVLARYDELLELLKSKYGAGRASHKRGDSIYAEPRYFLTGVRSGQSWHYTNFTTPQLAIELSVRAADNDTGFWVLFYENTQLAKDVEKEKREREKKSL